MLPSNRSSACRRRACASSVSWLPFSGSSPIERSRTDGSGTSRISWANTTPMCANWRRWSGLASAFAPASIRTVGPRFPGITIAMPGRSTPGSLRTWRSEAASIAPVFPAEITASASPSTTALTARTRDEPGFARTASAGFSCISIASGHTTRSSPCGSSPAGPNRTGSIVSEAAAAAPATTSAGA